MDVTVTSHSPIDKGLALVARGFHVFPCIVVPRTDGSGKTDKRPLTRHGHLDASNDPNVVELMFRMNPAATHVGIDCVKNVIDVLDIDSGDGEAFYQANKHLVPDTLHARTGSGGRHLLYKGDPNRNLKQRAYLGIDTRLCKPTGGGWVVAWEPAAFYDKDMIVDGWPDEFIRLANARPVVRPNGHATAWLQPPTTPLPSRINVADEIREYAKLGHVPIGSRDHFLMGAYGHAQKALREGMATTEQVGAFIGRISSIKMMSGDSVHDFAGKLARAKFTPAEVGVLLPYEGIDDGEPIVPFPKGGEFPVDPFEGYESIPGGETGFGEPNPFDRLDTGQTTFRPITVAAFEDPATKPFRMREWIVEGWVLKGQITQTPAQPGTGKSLLAVTLAVAMACNKPGLLLQGGTGWRKGPGGVLIVANEDDHEEWRKRLAACLLHHGMTWADLGDRVRWARADDDGVIKLYEKGRRDEPIKTNRKALGELERQVKEENWDCRLVVLDTQTSIMSGIGEQDEASMDFVMRDLIMWTRRLGVGGLVTHHTRKTAWDSDEGGLTMADSRGSGAAAGALRMMLGLEKIESKGQLANPHENWLRVVDLKNQYSRIRPDKTKCHARLVEVMLPAVDDDGNPGHEGHPVMELSQTGPALVADPNSQDTLIKALQIVEEFESQNDPVAAEYRNQKALARKLEQRLGCDAASAKQIVSRLEQKRLVCREDVLVAKPRTKGDTYEALLLTAEGRALLVPGAEFASANSPF